MKKLRAYLKQYSMHAISLLIATVLWMTVHGQGEGSVSYEVPLQVQGLHENLVIVNDLPDHVRITVSGLRSRLNMLNPASLHVPLDASFITAPGVIDLPIDANAVPLPVGLRVDRVYPDRVQLQVDRLVVREINIKPILELPVGFSVTGLTVDPPTAKLSGPEVWLDSLSYVETVPIRPNPVPGPFSLRVGLAAPAGKAIRLVNPDAKCVVQGRLRREPSKERR